VPPFRVATFNVENLFARFRFEDDVDPEDAVRDGWDVNETMFTILDADSKRLTGESIRAARPDVIALQEVENLDVLKRFRSTYLGGPRAFPYALSIDGNDPRLIDVGVLSKHPIVHVRSHQERRSGSSYLFSRDCLEVDVSVGGRPLTLFVNHLKSMLDQRDPANGRRNTRARRMLQAREVRKIVTERFGADAGAHPFVVLGDLNDYLDTDEQGSTGIAELVRWRQVENVVGRLPRDDRWTHYFPGDREGGLLEGYKQLDYMLVSRSLAARTRAVPEIVRMGLPTGAKRYKGPRFEGVGRVFPKASDHCPVVFELEL
jgi:endonuclease/exonuclease/phosphatase family metal-dependent hydrolase